ncbi:MAG: cytochrome b5 domain-containing protein [Candidatus Poribacteria bacterium]
MIKITKTELLKYNGKNGNSAYIAYKGKIYDVSDSFLWKSGKHQVFHQAGEDLTEAIADAPHGEEMLERFPIVGIIIDEEN